ncbi:unnamed protein product [Caenorhabditis angaria]|uniref:Uncharacterized protein n=1 Tax=Caenorhabditis angaria TaxID=860376 RepID=A0A9P1IBB2_9PELO|nr:unnamed protein product [Caenorhabditis angaria]
MHYSNTILVLLFALLIGCIFGNLYESEDGLFSPDDIPKRSLDAFWRNVYSQIPSARQGGQKRTENLSRASANAYYRLG